MITPDMGATALGVTATYVFWKWLKRPGWMLALAAGMALGLALLTKTTWIILFALWPALWLLWQASGGRKPPDASPTRVQQLLQLTTIFVLGVYLLNLGYAFEGSFERLGDFRFVSDTTAPPLRTSVSTPVPHYPTQLSIDPALAPAAGDRASPITKRIV